MLGGSSVSVGDRRRAWQVSPQSDGHRRTDDAQIASLITVPGRSPHAHRSSPITPADEIRKKMLCSNFLELGNPREPDAIAPEQVH